MLAWLAAFFPAVLQEPAQLSPERFDRTVSVELRSAGPAAGTVHASERIEHETGFAGTLHVWTGPEGIGLVLRVEDAGGKVLVEIGSLESLTVPYAELGVEAGREVGVSLSEPPSDAPTQRGPVVLYFVASAETPETQEAARRAADAVSQVRTLREGKDLAEARRRIAPVLDDLARAGDAARSELVLQALLDCEAECKALELPRESERAWRTILGIRSRTLPPDHRELQVARSKLANLLRARGIPEEALPLQEQVVAIFERTLPPDHEDLQMARGNLGLTLRARGDYAGAIPYLEGMVAAFERTLPGDDPRLLTARNNLAATLAPMGELDRARQLFESVLAVQSASAAEDDLNLQNTRLNVAHLRKTLGDRAGARALEEKVYEVYSRTLPDDHPDLQQIRVNLGVTLEREGDLAAARALQEKALEVYTRTRPADDPGLQGARIGLAQTVARLGDLAAARSLEEQVLEAWSRTLPDEHPDVQAARLNLSVTLVAMSDVEGARSLIGRVHDVYERTRPSDHAELQQARTNLAVTIAALHAVRGHDPTDVDEAERREFVRIASAFIDVRTAAVQSALRSPVREAEERCANVLPDLGRVLSFAEGLGTFPPDPGLEEKAFLLSERARGAALVSASHSRRARSHPRYAGLRRELASASEEIARQARAGSSTDDLARARTRRERAEQELLELANAASGAGTDLDCRTLASNLGEDEALIAFRRYERAKYERGAKSPVWAESLCAFVLRKRGRLVRVELGPCAPIEGAVAGWRDSLGVSGGRGVSAVPVGGGSEETLRQHGEAVRRLVFDPLAAELAGAEHLFVALDDVLHLVSLVALPERRDPSSAAREGALLGERWGIETRTTLLELLEEAPAPSRDGALLALGDPDYDFQPVDSRTRVPDSASPTRGADAGTDPLRGGPWESGFTPLPATSAEVHGVAEFFAEGFGLAAPRRVLDRESASRMRLLELSPGARFLHVATHGWFASDSIPSGGARQIRGMSPMVLCGLALAGANSHGDGRGLVTAEELSTLDLAECELAVLSACDTNVGDRRAGQGVASLQRALHMAGARTVVTSLWKVPDVATKDLMLDFYRRLWVEKKPKGQALWESKMRIRDARDERGTLRYSVRDWAAWVLTGDPD